MIPYILTVVVLLMGADEPTLTTHLVKDEAQCLLTANMVQDEVKRMETVFTIVACNPLEAVKP